MIMKIFQINKWFQKTVLICAVLLALYSCNKDIPVPEPITYTTGTGETIAQILTNNANYSFLLTAVKKVPGLLDSLNSKNNIYTVFAPSDDAFKASGIPSAAVVNSLPAAALAPLLQHHVIGGRVLNSALIPETFPNLQMPTLFVFPSPNTSPFARFQIFPSKRGSQIWVNNIPVIAGDINASNGVIHSIARVLAPPSRVLADTMARDPNLTFLMTAISRADQGLPSGSKFSQLLANAGTNFTVFAPNDQAFINLLTYLQLPPVKETLLALPISDVIGILAYHVHILSGSPGGALTMSRAFSVNLPKTPTPVNTFLNMLISPAPPLVVDASIPGVKGYKNPSYSNIVAVDRAAINGVYHVIDQVLLPK